MFGRKKYNDHSVRHYIIKSTLVVILVRTMRQPVKNTHSLRVLPTGFLAINYWQVISSIMTYHWVCIKSNMTGVTRGAGTAFSFGALEFTLGFQWSLCCSIFSFLCSVLQIIVCPFVLFLLAMVVSVLRFMSDDYPFGIFKLFLTYIQ